MGRDCALCEMTYQAGTEMRSSERPANNETQCATHTEPIRRTPTAVTTMHA